MGKLSSLQSYSFFMSRIVRKSAKFNSKDLLSNKKRGILHYDYVWTNTTAVNGFYDWVLKGNGLYDPDTAIGGDSVTGLASLSSIYDSYKVFGSRITVSVRENGGGVSTVAVIPNAVSSAFTYTDVANLAHMTKSKSVRACTQDGMVNLVSKATTSEVRGVKDVDDIGFSAALDADPTHCWYWHVVSWPFPAAAANTTLFIHIEYDVELTGVSQLSS